MNPGSPVDSHSRKDAPADPARLLQDLAPLLTAPSLDSALPGAIHLVQSVAQAKVASLILLKQDDVAREDWAGDDALRRALRGEFVKAAVAARAEKIGLLNDVYPDADAVLAAAYELAEEIAANAPMAVRGTKFILQQSEDLTTEQSLLLNGIWTMMTSLQSNDMREALKAFMEKRAPDFTGT